MDITLTESDISAIWLTIRLAAVTTVLLLLLATPLAWWLSRKSSGNIRRLKSIIGGFVTMPLILPPTVLGFYLLIAMGPQGPIGQLTQQLGIGLLPFTFWGLVIASMIYSLPFVVQPLLNAMSFIGDRPLEVAATMRASPLDTFFSVVIPMAKPGFISAAVLGFAHTVGEFGVVLMIGGNIPDETRVISIQIYDHVESLQYANAHTLAGGMVLFSLIVLISLNLWQGNSSNGNAGVVR